VAEILKRLMRKIQSDTERVEIGAIPFEVHASGDSELASDAMKGDP